MRENEDPSKKLWELWTPTKDDFELIDPQSPFCIGKLKCSIYYNLYCLYDSAQDIVDKWKAKQEGKKDICLKVQSSPVFLLILARPN
ncbi:hypothetical protein PAXRUDRAFT_21718 [Paxillus rubicundulus Ve08.2h10]|uniref:Unplaced genomic scaffold scaffold_5745, whole genome shotgun sequence n=1 Tax=Paxillus rubicundulus Ve08.2h10 TaxID=930991 RepID=A0A0D0CPD7_9AGAM|nr:hypothetical protein PAXRUDRAFT_21718 [Paxillus rubicundulus Ve08.2h10]